MASGSSCSDSRLSQGRRSFAILRGVVSPKTKKKIARRTTSRGYYSTPQWRALALACKARDGERCQLCNMGRTKKRRLHAHHILFRAECENVDALWNLITLCQVCHKALHATEQPSNRWRTVPESATKAKKPLSPAGAKEGKSGEIGDITDESSVS